MNFLLDENFTKAVFPLSLEKGHKAYDFRELGNLGADDRFVIQKAIELKAVLLTTDRDFFHTLPKLHP